MVIILEILSLPKNKSPVVYFKKSLMDTSKYSLMLVIKNIEDGSIYLTFVAIIQEKK